MNEDEYFTRIEQNLNYHQEELNYNKEEIETNEEQVYYKEEKVQEAVDYNSEEEGYDEDLQKYDEEPSGYTGFKEDEFEQEDESEIEEFESEEESESEEEFEPEEFEHDEFEQEQFRQEDEFEQDVAKEYQESELMEQKEQAAEEKGQLISKQVQTPVTLAADQEIITDIKAESSTFSNDNNANYQDTNERTATRLSYQDAFNYTEIEPTNLFESSFLPAPPLIQATTTESKSHDGGESLDLSICTTGKEDVINYTVNVDDLEDEIDREYEESLASCSSLSNLSDDTLNIYTIDLDELEEEIEKEYGAATATTTNAMATEAPAATTNTTTTITTITNNDTLSTHDIDWSWSTKKSPNHYLSNIYHDKQQDDMGDDFNSNTNKFQDISNIGSPSQQQYNTKTKRKFEQDGENATDRSEKRRAVCN